MSAEIVNLRRARKAKAREKAQDAAARNRATFGRPKSEREREDAAKTLEARRLDGHRREEDGSP